ncbi:MAG: hypothetical protein HKN84_10255 [Gammaproteobacteria bacterium]|nr:hypothetical protein [Gammaproteobacteria bacterium]
MAYRHLTVEQTKSAAPLSRRDFLRMHVSRGKRMLELSCERLYMRYADARSNAARRQVSNHDDFVGGSRRSTGFEVPTPTDLFDEFERQLGEADELRVLEPDWLNEGEFGREVGARVETFEQRGGQVQYGSFSSSPTSQYGERES